MHAGPVCRSGMPMRLRGGDRKYCIAGNWKMNPATLDDAKKLANEVLGPNPPWLRRVASCPPRAPEPPRIAHPRMVRGT
jgi:hypothetical protein